MAVVDVQLMISLRETHEIQMSRCDGLLNVGLKSVWTENKNM